MKFAALSVVAFGLSAFGASCARAPDRPNILLITVDTLRTDRMSVYGFVRETTPALELLASEGVLFTHCQSPRAKTTPALASLMSGLYPHEHGVRDLTMPLEEGIPVLAESLRDAGYQTGAVIGNYVVRKDLSGLSRGFDKWIEEMPDSQGVPPDSVPQRTAASMTDAALSLLGMLPGEKLAPKEDKPWFLWLHYMDPHGLYDPPTEHQLFQSIKPDPIPPDPGQTPGQLNSYWVAWYNVPASARRKDGVVDAAIVRDLYDGEVHYVDHEIGRLTERLRREGLLDETLLMVTSDHGESLGEHAYWFEHGRHAYEVTCRVPLLMRFPKRMRKRPAFGQRDGDISLCDLAPTLLDLLEIPPLPLADGLNPTSKRGVSRLGLLFEDVAQPRAVFSEKVERADKSRAVQTKAVRMGDWKFIRRYTHLFEPDRPDERELVVLSEELYDLGSDRFETRNRIGDPPAEAPLERMQAELLEFSRADVRFEDLAQLLQAKREELERNDKATLRILEALGY